VRFLHSEAEAYKLFFKSKFKKKTWTKKKGKYFSSLVDDGCQEEMEANQNLVPILFPQVPILYL